MISDRYVPMIRKATFDDARAIARVHTHSWKAAYRGHMPDEVLDNLSVRARTKRWKKLLESQHPPNEVWLAFADDKDDEDDKPIGFASIGASRDLDAEATEIGEIYAIYVLEAYWGEGVGHRLLERALDRLQAYGFDEVTLWVLDSNERARRFYEREGFTHDGIKRIDERPNMTLEEVRYRKRLEAK